MFEFLFGPSKNDSYLVYFFCITYGMLQFWVIPSYGVVKKVVQSDGFHEIFTFAIFSLNFQRRLMQ
jgi:hypothetical protein